MSYIWRQILGLLTAMVAVFLYNLGVTHSSIGLQVVGGAFVSVLLYLAASLSLPALLAASNFKLRHYRFSGRLPSGREDQGVTWKLSKKRLSKSSSSCAALPG